MNKTAANSKQQTANSKQQTANSKQQTANSKQQTAIKLTFSNWAFFRFLLMVFPFFPMARISAKQIRFIMD
ncbi:MAG: hypothetical protein IPK62_11470 [Bacteroidetes bacterium]|nr:hypothetical protein [Bacteroidota bacterium]